MYGGTLQEREIIKVLATNKISQRNNKNFMFILFSYGLVMNYMNI